MYTIKQVAEQLGVRENAVRFYEKKGLIQPERGENQYRQYKIEDMSRLQMILLYRRMGFSVAAIGKLVKEEPNQSLLDIFVKQSQLLNRQIHTFNEIMRAVNTCVDEMLYEDRMDDRLLELLNETSKKMSDVSSWRDLWNFDSWAEHYDEDIRRQGDGIPFYKNYDKVIAKTVRAVKEKEGNILEIGIGTGNLMNEMLHGGIGKEHLFAIDQSVNMLKVAKRKCPNVRMKVGTYLEIPFEAGTMDAIVSSYAFHHNNEKEKVLAIKEMDRVIKGHGRIIITDLMFANQEERCRYEEKCGEKQREELEDEFFANVDIVQIMLEKLGYTVKTTQIDSLIWLMEGEK